VTYAGTTASSRGSSRSWDAAEAFRDDPRVAFAFVGEGARKDALIQEAKRRGLSRVTFHKAVAKERVPEIYSASDVLVVCLRPLPIFRSSSRRRSSKRSRPAAPSSPRFRRSGRDRPRRRRLVAERAMAGQSRQRSGSSSPIRPRAEAMGDRGRRYVREHYDRQTLAPGLPEDLEMLTR